MTYRILLIIAFLTQARREIYLFFKAVQYALAGLGCARSERSLHIEIVCGIFAIILGIIFRINRIEWMFVSLSMALVIGLELINTAVEKLATKVKKENDDDIKAVKDITAAAVLVACTSALLIGALIFVPRIYTILF